MAAPIGHPSGLPPCVGKGLRRRCAGSAGRHVLGGGVASRELAGEVRLSARSDKQFRGRRQFASGSFAPLVVYRVRVSKYVVVIPFEPLRVGGAFAVDEWPLHVTVLPNFRTQAARRDVINVLQSVCRTLGPVSATVGGEELFGPSGDLLANVITDHLPVQQLHEALFEALTREVEFVLEMPEYTRAGYRPHVTLTRPLDSNTRTAR